MTEVVGAAVFFIAVISIILFFTITMDSKTITFNNSKWKLDTYIVQENDTLFSLAERFCPKDQNKRYWISEVENFNELSESYIVKGQLIFIYRYIG